MSSAHHLQPTRALLTSLSPHPSYVLGHALGLGESGGQDHESTLLHPPQAKLLQATTTVQQQQQLTANRSDESDDGTGATITVQKWYTLYSSGLSLCCREVEAWRDDHDSSLIYATGFNTPPHALAVDDSCKAPNMEAVRCLAGFANGAVMLFNPFLEMVKATAIPMPIMRPEEQEANHNASSTAALSGAGSPRLTQPSSSYSSSPPFLTTDRTFNASNVQTAGKVSCLAWIPKVRPPPSASISSSSTSTSASPDQFLVGLEDGRLLIFDTRLEKETKLPDHPSPVLTKAELKLRKKALEATVNLPQSTTVPPQVWSKEFMSIIHAPLAPTPTATTTSAATSSSTPQYASNPIASWKLYAPPTSASSASGMPVSTSILALAFSISGTYLAISLSSGHIAIFNYPAERLVICFKSYYGHILDLTWTTDERYLLTGGEDDRVCLWDPFVKKTCVMMGEGHANFVTKIEMRPSIFRPIDPASSAQTSSVNTLTILSSTTSISTTTSAPSQSPSYEWDGIYRFISIGQDKCLLFWQISTDVLNGNDSSDHTKSSLTAAASNLKQPTKDLLVDRPVSPNPTTAAVTSSSLPAPISPTFDLSTYFHPSHRKGGSPISLYPMAKNIIAERALSDLSSGFDMARKRLEYDIFHSAGISSASNSTTTSSTKSLTSHPTYTQPSVLPLCDDLLLTICHGHHLQLWSRIPPNTAPGVDSSLAPLNTTTTPLTPRSPPNRLNSLNSRLQRLNTPVLSTLVQQTNSSAVTQPSIASATATATAAQTRTVPQQQQQAPAVVGRRS